MITGYAYIFVNGYWLCIYFLWMVTGYVYIFVNGYWLCIYFCEWLYGKVYIKGYIFLAFGAMAL
jgi:hypothetical protein